MTGPPFSLRRGNLDDIETLVRLRLALLCDAGNLTAGADRAALAAAIRRYLAEGLPSGEFIAWVAVDPAGDQIIGSSGLVFLHRPPSWGNLAGLEAYVMNIYTLPEWRGRGVATALLDEVLGLARGRGAGRVWLHATEAGRQIYERAGFRPSRSTSEMELVW